MAEYTDKQLERMVYSKKYYRRAEAARYGVGLDILVEDKDPTVRCVVAKQGYGLDKLVHDDNWMVLIEVAKQEYGLDILAQNMSGLVRKAVAEQGYGLGFLLNDSFPDVRAAARASVCERLPETLREVFGTSLVDIGLSQRVVNRLLPRSPGGLRTVGDLAMAPVERLGQISGLGEKSQREIKEKFAAYFKEGKGARLVAPDGAGLKAVFDLLKAEVEKVVGTSVDDSNWFMRDVFKELEKQTVLEGKHMNLRVYHNDTDESIREYGNALKFWSNAIGELHSPEKGDIGRDDLPEELKRVYDELYWEPSGGASLRYFVETEKGYGIGLLNEYDVVTASSSGIAFEQLFETVVKDAQEIVKDPLLGKFEVFAGASLGFDGCHEMVVVVPWDTPVEEYVKAAKRLDDFVYCGCGLNKDGASVSVDDNLDDVIQFCEDKNKTGVSKLMGICERTDHDGR